MMTADRNPDPKKEGAQQMRRIVTALSALIAGAMTVVMTASAAYAHLPAPPPGGADGTTTQVIVHHTGLFGWQIAVIVVAAAMLLGIAATLVARRVRISSRRPLIS
jgi:hypothetical protein